MTVWDSRVSGGAGNAAHVATNGASVRSLLRLPPSSAAAPSSSIILAACDNMSVMAIDSCKFSCVNECTPSSQKHFVL